MGFGADSAGAVFAPVVWCVLPSSFLPMKRPPLLAEAKLAEDGSIARQIRPAQIRQLPATLSYQLEESALRVVVMLVFAHVRRKLGDPLGEECDL